MPYLAVIVPDIPEGDKDNFLAAWPTIVDGIKASPLVLGVSGGPIVGEDGAAAKEFKFLQTIAFKSQEDEKAFAESDFVLEGKKKYEEKGVQPAKHATFEVPEFPTDAKPSAFTQISRMVIEDESKGPEVKKAWEDLVAILGKKTWGGRSVGDGPKSGIGLIGWDSLEEAGAAYANPAAKAAIDHYHSFGDHKDVMVKLELY